MVCRGGGGGGGGWRGAADPIKLPPRSARKRVDQKVQFGRKAGVFLELLWDLLRDRKAPARRCSQVRSEVSGATAGASSSCKRERNHSGRDSHLCRGRISVCGFLFFSFLCFNQSNFSFQSEQHVDVS